jgi:argininosuccinate lyase
MAGAVDASLYATDLVDELTAKGVAFREAHGIVAALAARAERGNRPLDSYSAAEWTAVHPALGEDTPAVFNAARSIARKTTTGSTNPEMVRRQMAAARSRLAMA